MKNYLFVFLFAFAGTSLFAQDKSLGSWNIMNIKGLLSNKWSYFAEAQIRSLKYYNDFHYHEFKGGVTYEINGQFRVSMATGKYDTYREGGDFVLPKNNDEFRLWPQLLLTQELGKFIVEQRGRVEMRFSKNGYRNRFRYRLGLNYPFGKNEKGFTPFQFSASNEIFFTDNEPYFERNRFFLSASYRLSELFSTQMGYLRQFDYKINDETGRTFFLIGLYFDVDFFKKG
jgi:Protein of unknown function (DUF2490)